MDLSEQQLIKVNDFLNRHAVHLAGQQVQFYVHYWGGETNLIANEVHKHSFFELCYVISGQGIYSEEDVNYTLQAGNLFLSRPNIKHSISNTSELCSVFVAFEPLYNDCSEEANAQFHFLSKSKNFLIENASNSITIKLWDTLLTLSLHDNLFIEDTVEKLSFAMILQSITLFLSDSKSSKYPIIQRSSTTFVHRAKLYIRDNLSQPLRLSDVAAYLHLSSRHLSRIFVEELGQTFSNYVRLERIRQASHLLSTTDRSIKIIAEETGFTTVHYFTSVFKEVLGVTPGDFQKKLFRNE